MIEISYRNIVVVRIKKQLQNKTKQDIHFKNVYCHFKKDIHYYTGNFDAIILLQTFYKCTHNNVEH